MALYHLHVNGKEHAVEAVSDMPLLWALRDLLDLTGTKYGCGIGACGACTVLINGKAERSCQVDVSSVGNKKVVTIEGLSTDGNHPLQKAWIEHDVPACGYCQTGQIMSAAALLAEKPHPTDKDIDDAYNAHICRCGTYDRIREAVKAVAKGEKA
jgi:isoquinoline 1-oxidoreductase subunit alpha